MNLVQLNYDDHVAIVSLSNGAANPLSVALFMELEMALEQVHKSTDVTGMIFTSESEKFLSIGLDIPSLFPLNKHEALEAYRALNRSSFKLLTLKIPTVCAIKGHATAGGCILALMCDYRLMAEGHKLIGLNEIKLGLHVPLLAYQALNMICDDHTTREMAYTGNFLDPAAALQAGLVDAVLPAADLMQGSLIKVKSIAGSNIPAFAAIKEMRIAFIRRIFEEGREEDERRFMDLWFSDEVQGQLRQAIAKF
jgi:enoyl-CoA hydratase/carnithine racemase